MAIDTNKPQLSEIAQVLNDQLDRTKNLAKDAKNKLGTDHGPLMVLVRQIKSLDKSIDGWFASGLTQGQIGQAWADGFGVDWASVSADFAGFRSDAAALFTWLRTNNDQIRLSVDATTGVQKYDVAMDAPKQAEVLALLNAIIARFA